MCGIYTPDQLKLGFPLHILGIGSAAVGQTWQSSVRGEGGGYRRSTGKLGRTTHQWCDKPWETIRFRID